MANARVWLWIAALVAILFFAARGANDLVGRTHEYAYGCDSFGFLVQAKSIREAVAESRLPDFHIDAPQTRLLIDDLKSRRIRYGRWGELVAPHAHHYMPRAGRVGLQYPPGTGLALAAFPAGVAVAGLSRVAIALLVVAGAAALLYAGARRAVVSAGLVLLAIVLGLDLMVRYATRSYSILAVAPPLLLAAILAATAASQREGKPRLASIAAFGAGACLGFALLVRIPTALLIPGYLLLVLPRPLMVQGSQENGGVRARRSRFAPVLALLVALAITGVAPLLLHQQLVAGAWYKTTYGSADASPPRFDASALRYYLGDGDGSGEGWALLPAIAGFLAAVVVTTRSRRRIADGLTWARVGTAAGAIWLASTVFFLTHQPALPYYTSPGTFAAVCVLALGALAIEARSRDGALAASGPVNRKAAMATFGLIATIASIALALVPVVAATARVTRLERDAPPQTAAPPPIALPAELADERAWVWADELTGTFWYYARKPAFKVAFGSEETRAGVYRFVQLRGEPQFVVRDSPTMDRILEEIDALGGTLEPRGEVAGVPYYSVRWPTISQK